MNPHLQALCAALDSEQAFVRAELKQALSLPLEDQIALGVAWPVFTLQDWAPAGKGRTLLTLRSRDALHEGITPGNPVFVQPAGRSPLRGQCLAVDDHTAEVRVDSYLSEATSVQIRLRFDNATYQAYTKALQTAGAKAHRLTQVLLGERPLSAPSAHHPALPPALTLNPSQRRALQDTLTAGELALVHGPPGTGKTHLIVALLQTLVGDGDTPWALADSNAATDHLAVRAAAAGLTVVRLGPMARIAPEVEPLSLHWRIQHGSLGAVLHKLDRELMILWADPSRKRDRRARIREREALYDQARGAVLEQAQVIACTLGSLPRYRPLLSPAHTAIVDEATQAIEPAIWTAIPHVQRLVLVGDPHQLGPVVREPGNPLQTTLFERLLAQKTAPLPMLTTQHRMNRSIQNLVAPVYGDAYTPHPAVEAHHLHQLPGVASTPLTSHPVIWIDTAGADNSEHLDPLTRSLYNLGEITLVVRVVQQLRQAGVQPAQIGVITPYSAQRTRLLARPELADVEVGTVNAFQGREKEAIIGSFVRSNPDGQLGFVADRRRLVVASTRARRAWMGIGDSATLGSSPDFAAWLARIEQTGVWYTVWEDPWML